MSLFKHGGFSRPGQHYKKPKRWGYVEISRDGEAPYLKRWYLWRCKWFSIRIHHFTGPDPDPDLHDHPWNFISIPFLGSYTEVHRSAPTEVVDFYFTTPENHPRVHRTRRRWFGRHKATDAHSVVELHRKKGVWTLFLTGRETRKWGFVTIDGWKPYEEYLGIQ